MKLFCVLCNYVKFEFFPAVFAFTDCILCIDVRNVNISAEKKIKNDCFAYFVSYLPKSIFMTMALKSR